MESIFILLRRVCVCGLFSAIIMALARETGQKEIVRLCCACAMIISIFSPLPRNNAEIGDISLQKENFQQSANSAMADLEKNQTDAMCTAIESYAQGQAKSQGAECRIEVEGKAEDGVLVITRANIFCKPSASQTVQNILINECAIGANSIFYSEEGIDGKE